MQEAMTGTPVPTAASDRTRKAAAIIPRLRREYGPAKPFLRFVSPLELLVATILSAQCTDKKVNEVTGALFAKYRSAGDFARAHPQELENEIRQTGFFRNKAANIIAAARQLCADHGGQVPDTMEALTSLPGVARKTANIVLSGAFGKAAGIAVDTHVGRLAQRLGLSDFSSPEKIEKDLIACISRQDWIDMNYLLVAHGRAVCKARTPRCGACVLQTLCPSCGI
jgi:endonuclease III